MVSRTDSLWYRNSPLSLLLAPIGWLYCAAAIVRRGVYRLGIAHVGRVGAPVIVVGNISVGGTGKTPLVIWLARFLMSHGLRPGIVSGGYRGRADKWPQQVRPDSDPVMVGDEPVLLAQATGCPVVADPDRLRAATSLLAHARCDVLISDDGLQHLALGRDVEIAVLDGVRRHGNGRCLPAGPLREPVSRLDSVDMVVANGGGIGAEFHMRVRAGEARNLAEATLIRSLETFKPGPVHAVCGIGSPERFFASYFEDSVWPLLAAMVPKFETLKLERTWGGHYAQNLFDGNMILGRYAPGLENTYTACGFSGHGVMHAPAVGRALAELVLDRDFQTLDLSRLGAQRIRDDDPYPELGIR